MAMRAYFFLDIWKDYIEKVGHCHSEQWYSCHHSFISHQSYNIFKSLAESLVLLILAHRDFYASFPLLPWEHGTEALEHVFGIARQIVPDFTFYEFYKIIRRVMSHDKILREGNFTFSQEKTVVSGE